MKTNKFIAIMLLGVLATACSKDDNNRLTLLAEGFTNGNSKVLIDPTNIPAGAQWVVGEPIKVNNQVYTIQQDEVSNEYQLESSSAGAFSGNLTAYYPGQSFDGNVISIDGNTIVLNKLVAEFVGGKQKMAFPMGATASNKDAVLFRHLTGGLRLELKTTSGTKDVARLKVIAQSNTNNATLQGALSDFSARWAVQETPMVPIEPVGQNGETVDVKYISEMNFDLKSGSNNYVTIGSENSTMLCIPITISPVIRLVIIGYDTDGQECFHVKKDFTTPVTVERNKMYTVPQISII